MCQSVPPNSQLSQTPSVLQKVPDMTPVFYLLQIGFLQHAHLFEHLLLRALAEYSHHAKRALFLRQVGYGRNNFGIILESDWQFDWASIEVLLIFFFLCKLMAQHIQHLEHLGPLALHYLIANSLGPRPTRAGDLHTFNIQSFNVSK